jgi:hypothetical protein
MGPTAPETGAPKGHGLLRLNEMRANMTMAMPNPMRASWVVVIGHRPTAN